MKKALPIGEGDDDDRTDPEVEWTEVAGDPARFVLQHRYSRKLGGRPVPAGTATGHWDLRIDAGEGTLRHWTLDRDVTGAGEAVGHLERDEDRRAMEAEGFFPSGSCMDPMSGSRKGTPSFVEVLDEGECHLLVDEPGFVEVEFDGTALRGAWLLEKRDEERFSDWHVRRVHAAPRALREGPVACSR
jgi:hypothetical protein